MRRGFQERGGISIINECVQLVTLQWHDLNSCENGYLVQMFRVFYN